MQITTEIVEEGVQSYLRSKGFTKRTIKTYNSIISKTIAHLGTNFSELDAENWLTSLDLQPRTYNLYRAIINFYCKKQLGFSLTFSKAKVPNYLPTYVTRDEFAIILNQIPNIKHKLGLMLMYSSGLRSYEVCRLKRHNINFNNLIIRVIGKGKKERQTVLHPQVVDWLEMFIKSTDERNPFIFQTYRRHISERSFQAVLQRAIRKAGLHKKISLHSLRHSFAINLINQGIDIEEIRKMLGHSSLKTTQIYLQCKTASLKSIALQLEKNIWQCQQK